MLISIPTLPIMLRTSTTSSLTTLLKSAKKNAWMNFILLEQSTGILPLSIFISYSPFSFLDTLTVNYPLKETIKMILRMQLFILQLNCSMNSEIESLRTCYLNSITSSLSQCRMKELHELISHRQSDLWNEIQGKVNTLPDSALDQIFEVQQTKDKIKEHAKALQDELGRLTEKDKQFVQFAAAFTKRVE